MSWFKFDDGFHSHPKVQALFEGPCPGDAIALFTISGSWCSKELTDGVVPLGFVRRSGLHKDASAELVRVRLFDACEDGSFRVHNYLKYNPSRAQVLAEREKTKQRVTRHRNGGSNGVTNTVTEGVSQAVHQENDGVSTLAPVPDPVPNSLPDKNSYPTAAEPSYAPASARESGGALDVDPEALRGSRWLYEALGGHHAYDAGVHSKHRHALTQLARKPATELAAARAALDRERMKPGVLDMLKPQHLIDHWHLYGQGKAPGKPAANGGGRGRRAGPSRVPTPAEYAKDAQEKAPWET